MKVSSVENPARRSQNNLKELKTSTNNNKYISASNSDISFGNGTDMLIKFWEAVDRGGLAASFTVQDMLGTNIPRTVAARNVGKEYTGKNNWKAVAENGLREFLTGPSMFAVPAAVLYGTMRVAGKSHGVPVESIHDLSKIVKDNAGKIDTSSLESFRKDLYSHVLGSVFSNLDNLNPKNSIKVEEYVENILKMENAPKKGLIKNILGRSIPESKEEILQGIVENFVRDKKANTKGYPDFLSAKIFGSSSDVPFEKLLDRMNKFSEDFFKTLKKSSNPDTIASEFVDNFSHKRMGGRFITNIAMGIFTALAMWFIPKIYTIGKTNPETDPVRQKASQLKGTDGTAEKSDDKTADTDKKEGDVSFSGGGISKLVTNLGQKISPDAAGNMSKVAGTLESDWINVARPIFLSLITGFTLVPRLIQSAKRDIESSKKNGGPVQWDETSNILRRDVTTIITILFAMKGLGSIMAHNASKKTGVILTNKILDDKTSFFKKFKEFFNSEGGVVALSKKQNTSRTSVFANADEIARFFEDTEAKNGNLHKMLNIDAKSKNPVLYPIAEKLFGKEKMAKADINAEELADVMRKAEKAGAPEFEDFKALLNNKELNPLLKFANKINAVFETVSLAIVTGFLGFGLPKLNELLIKKKYLKDDKTLQAKYQNPDMQIPDFNILNDLKPMEKRAFQYFLGNIK